MIVIGSMISLGYYLRVIAAMWMRDGRRRPARGPSGRRSMAGGSPEARRTPRPQCRSEVAFVAVVFGAASIFFGIIPTPLFHLAEHAGRSLGLL